MDALSHKNPPSSRSCGVAPDDESLAVRWVGLGLGVFTHLAFLLTVYLLFGFLRNGVQPSTHAWLYVDTMLALQFAVTHSWMLHPVVKRRLTRYIKPEWYGLAFCLWTCSSLALIFTLWRGSSAELWDAHGWIKTAVLTGFYASWVTLFYSLWLSGLGYQTGFTPWWHWLTRRPQPRRQFAIRGLYRYLRHPIYLSFLGLIWFTPRMSWDHATLTFIWTAYIFVGSYLKDERLAHYSGSAYREYQTQVAGYPLILWGPLSRRRVDASRPMRSQSAAPTAGRAKAA